MGKNKNRTQHHEPHREHSPSHADQAEQRMKSPVAEQTATGNGPADAPRKRTKRFGHN